MNAVEADAAVGAGKMICLVETGDEVSVRTWKTTRLQAAREARDLCHVVWRSFALCRKADERDTLLECIALFASFASGSADEIHDIYASLPGFELFSELHVSGCETCQKILGIE